MNRKYVYVLLISLSTYSCFYILRNDLSKIGSSISSLFTPHGFFGSSGSYCMCLHPRMTSFLPAPFIHHIHCFLLFTPSPSHPYFSPSILYLTLIVCHPFTQHSSITSSSPILFQHSCFSFIIYSCIQFFLCFLTFFHLFFFFCHSSTIHSSSTSSLFCVSLFYPFCQSSSISIPFIFGLP